jgi:hypothetical protein
VDRQKHTVYKTSRSARIEKQNNTKEPLFITDMEAIISALNNARKQYNKSLSYAQKRIQKKVEFDFYIMYQESDGFVIVDKEESHNAHLSTCLYIIEQKGRLSLDDFMDARI